MNIVNKARKPIVLLGLITLFISIITVTVFAAYNFTRKIEEEDVNIGDISVDSKNYLTYAKYPTDDKLPQGIEVNSANYYLAKKMRIDTLCILDGFQMKPSYERDDNPDFTSSNAYFYEDPNTGAYVRAQSYQSGTQYYVATYALNSVKSAYDANVNKLTVTISSNTLTIANGGSQLAILTVQIDSSTGLLSGISSVKKSNDNVGNLRAILGNDYLSVTIIDDDLITASNQPQEITLEENANKVTCFASYRNKSDSRIDYTLPYLNQLGLEFEFTVKIPVYVRIHIQDAWVSTQFLSSKSERVRYVSKDKISGSSPFMVSSSDWYYDAGQNIAYYKGMFMPIEDNGEFTSQTFAFNVNEGYFYYDKSAQAAQKITTVQVSFTIDIVQANRAEKLWNVDFDELFGE